MPRFRKKPIVVEAVLLTMPVTVETLEGTMLGQRWGLVDHWCGRGECTFVQAGHLRGHIRPGYDPGDSPQLDMGHHRPGHGGGHCGANLVSWHISRYEIRTQKPRSRNAHSDSRRRGHSAAVAARLRRVALAARQRRDQVVAGDRSPNHPPNEWVTLRLPLPPRAEAAACGRPALCLGMRPDGDHGGSHPARVGVPGGAVAGPAGAGLREVQQGASRDEGRQALIINFAR